MTGLPDRRVFEVVFERKVAAARRHLRPLTLALLDVAPGLPEGGDPRAQALRLWGAVVTETLREADVACRLDETTFALMLEDTAQTGGVWVIERLQIAASCARGKLLGPIRAAVATYPTHGLTSEELVGRARIALDRAQPGGAGLDSRFGQVELPSD
jgi:GGDEF domain-containing protein